MKQLNEPAAILMKNMKKFMPSADDVIPPLLQKYSLYAFSNRGYGFFSPNVPSGWTLYFKIQNEQNQVEYVKAPLHSILGRERVNTSVNWYKDNEDLRPLVAQSWGVRIFELLQNEYSSVQVICGIYRLPTMEDYRAGVRKKFFEHTKFVFQKNA